MKRYPYPLRTHALALIRSGVWSLPEIALITEIDRVTLWRWARAARLDPAAIHHAQRHRAIIKAQGVALAVRNGDHMQPTHSPGQPKAVMRRDLAAIIAKA